MNLALGLSNANSTPSMKPLTLVRPARPNHDTVMKQLSHILRSDGFVHANRMRRFLEFIVGETLAGRASHLCEYSIGVTVFGRDESFEPALDPIVRNDARRLRQKLLEYYQREGERDAIVIAVPKGGYVPVFTRATHPAPVKLGRQYRFIVTLVRVADGAEIWRAEHEFRDEEPAAILWRGDS